MAQVTHSIDVDVPVSRAYNQWTQFETFPQFLGFVDSIVQLTDTLTRWKVTIGGAEREFDAEITEQHSDERIAWKSVGGDAVHAGVVTFQALSPDSSRVSVQLDWAADTFLEKVGAALGVDDHAVIHDLENFKLFIENAQTSTGAWRGDVPTKP
ncbi:SRPBCC family protein [Glaciihabitans sp. dw_435]|uniref:SRPBCC family protein n=1 Tax=Glaciihabitans sp. dw_435 TaxID=2720081 RepID=UPI001BD47147|nr:SRPBCC family protein [Glaciihabitans sp. dw_435]